MARKDNTELVRVQSDTYATLKELNKTTDIPLGRLVARAVREYASNHQDDA